MGALALVALLAGGPLGMCLALAYGAVSVMKIAKVDSQYAAKGEMPPSARLVEKWLDSRAAKGAKPQKIKPYGSWAYAKQRWSALWEALGDKHRADYALEKKARADAIAQGLPLPRKPSAKDRAAAGWKWVLDKVVTPVGEKRAENPKPTAPAAGAGQGGPSITLAEVMPTAPTAPTPDPDAMRIACEDCGQTLTDNNGVMEHPSSSGCPRKPAHVNTTFQPIAATTKPSTSPPTKSAEGDNMTITQTGEVTGIPSAIHYLRTMAASHEAHAAQQEALVARMADMKVGAADLGMVQSAAAASLGAAQLFTEAADSIQKNNQAVREAYGSAPEAADKRAQLAE
jgi:hypothetical protein